MRAPNAQSDRVIHNGCAAGKLKEQCKQYGDQFTRTTPRQTSPEFLLRIWLGKPTLGRARMGIRAALLRELGFLSMSKDIKTLPVPQAVFFFLILLKKKHLRHAASFLLQRLLRFRAAQDLKQPAERPLLELRRMWTAIDHDAAVTNHLAERAEVTRHTKAGCLSLSRAWNNR